jgi:hypothetical protein
VNVQVGTLTVRGSRRDAGFRVRTESRLRSLDLHPPSLPGHAILIVRRLELPAADRAAARQARIALDRLGQTAARPAAGPVAADAPVVLFRDEVELLACLTADLVRGVAYRRWYWRHICPAMAAEPGAELAAAWTRDVRWLPGSLARLPAPEARQAVSLLSPLAAARVLRALLGAFGAEQALPPSPTSSRLDTTRGRTDQLDATAQLSSGSRPTNPPWRRWLPITTLHPHAEALLGTALSLDRSPALVRQPTYAEQLAAWWTAVDNATQQRASSNKASRLGAIPGETAPADAQSGRAQPGPGQSMDTSWTRASRSADRPAPGSPISAAVGAEAPTFPVSNAAPMPGPADTPRTFAQARLERILETSGVPALREILAEPPRKDEAADPGPSTSAGEEIATDLASLLFLVNFVVWLDTEADTFLASGWALVEFLGRYLLGDQLSKFADDPLWDALAELDGRRPGTAPAVEIGAEYPLRLPPAWLQRWVPPNTAYIAHRNRERVVVRHPQAGFIVADVPCPAGCFDEVCKAEAALLGGVEIFVKEPDASESPTPERRFGEVVGAFVGWLLRSRGITVSSLTSPGLVLVTRTHVDVVLSLEDVDLSVRVAGLDRDPGWVPMLGRIVLFHFLETS